MSEGLTFRALSRGDGAAVLGEVELGNVGQLLHWPVQKYSQSTVNHGTVSVSHRVSDPNSFYTDPDPAF